MDHGRFLDLALGEAEQALREGSSPFGALVVAPDGTVLSRGRNRALSTGDQTAHAEVDAIRNAGSAIMTPPSGAGWILYSSAEPCLMCLGAILLCPIQTVVWAAGSAADSAYRAVRSGAYRRERLESLDVVAEPSPTHRDRSRALVATFLRQRSGR